MTELEFEQWIQDPYLISTDQERLDVAFIHGYIIAAYWARGRFCEQVQRSIEGSIAFGLYHNTEQIGFARVITDYATTAHLADVFVIDAHQGKGLGKRLIEAALNHPRVRSIPKWTLSSSDAQSLYYRYGFKPLSDPGSLMERVSANSDTLSTIIRGEPGEARPYFQSSS